MQQGHKHMFLGHGTWDVGMREIWNVGMRVWGHGTQGWGCGDARYRTQGC